jgi:AcrR family transcriptional regulator
MTAASSPNATRLRLLEATREVLGRYGPRKIALAEIARVAGVSRPTLYKYYPSKGALLEALAAYERARFDDGMNAAVQGLDREARIDAALRFVVDYQASYPTRHLIALEPGFVLEQVAASMGVMRKRMRILFEDASREPGLRALASPEDLADLVVRTAVSHFLIPSGDRMQLLRELRAVAGLSAPVMTPIRSGRF